MPTQVVIYHPTLTDQYAALLRPRFPDLQFVVADNEASVAAVIPDAEILLAHISFPAQVLAAAPHLGWVQIMGAGADRIVPLVPPGVRVSRLTGSFGQRLAEYAIGYILAITQRVPEVVRNQAAHRWQPLDLGVARGRTLGVAGLGSIGSVVARLGASIGLRVTACSRHRPAMPEVETWFPAGEFPRFLGSADFIALTLPVTPETRHIVNRDVLPAMRDGAWLLNLSRGALVAEDDLLAGLRRGTPAGAVLDVFETEPLPATHPFWEMPNVIITPHHGGAAVPEELVELFEENLGRYQRHEPLRDEVDLARGY